MSLTGKKIIYWVVIYNISCDVKCIFKSFSSTSIGAQDIIIVARSSSRILIYCSIKLAMSITCKESRAKRPRMKTEEMSVLILINNKLTI